MDLLNSTTTVYDVNINPPDVSEQFTTAVWLSGG